MCERAFALGFANKTNLTDLIPPIYPNSMDKMNLCACCFVLVEFFT